MVSYHVSVWHFQLVRKKPWKELRGADAQAVGWTCVGTTMASTALFVEGTVWVLMHTSVLSSHYVCAWDHS